MLRAVNPATGRLIREYPEPSEDEVEQRLGQQGYDLAFSPVMAEAAGRGGRFTGRLRLMSLAVDRIRESWKLGHVFAMRLPNGLALR